MRRPLGAHFIGGAHRRCEDVIMNEEIKSRLRTIVVKSLRLDLSPDSIPDHGLTSLLGIDSLNSLELLVWVENEFDIEIDDDDLSVELVDSLDVLAEYVAARLAAPVRARSLP
jgi:acyl carrier protein